jgi:hypothetical protein
MNAQQDTWSVWPFSRFDAEEPERERRVKGSDGKWHVVLDPLDPAWVAKHQRHGSRIHDHDRAVTYEATVDERGRLDYLRVTFESGRLIDENAMRRVPVATIRRVVLEQHRERAALGDQADEVLSFVLPGGLRERPTLEEVAELMGQGYDRPALHAMYPNVNKRTVDGWMVRARRLQTPDGKSPSGPRKESR